MSQNYSYLRTILEKRWKIKTFAINIFEVENCDILLFCSGYFTERWNMKEEFHTS